MENISMEVDTHLEIINKKKYDYIVAKIDLISFGRFIRISKHCVIKI